MNLKMKYSLGSWPLIHKTLIGCGNQEPGWKYLLLILLLCMGLKNVSFGQSVQSTTAPVLEVGFDNTVFLVFDSPVMSADRGNRHLLAQKDEAAPNILKIKSAARQSPPTNLHVVTQAGKVYGFQVRYKDTPGIMTHYFGDQTALLKIPHNRKAFEQYTSHILEQSSWYKVKSKNHQVSVWLLGIFEIGDMIYLKLGLHNGSKLNYAPDKLGFQIKDRTVANRTTQRETYLQPVYNYASPWKGEAQNQFSIHVFAFERFGLDKTKRLEVGISESKGDRNLLLKIKGKHFQKAESIPHVQL